VPVLGPGPLRAAELVARLASSSTDSPGSAKPIGVRRATSSNSPSTPITGVGLIAVPAVEL
jgi:hypothetical protein